jgi:hypothetical protein
MKKEYRNGAFGAFIDKPTHARAISEINKECKKYPDALPDAGV